MRCLHFSFAQPSDVECDVCTSFALLLCALSRLLVEELDTGAVQLTLDTPVHECDGYFQS